MASTTFRTKDKDDHMEQAKESGSEALSKAQNAGKEAMSAAKEAGSDTLNKVREVGSDALGKARDAMSSVGDIATQSVTTAGQKADDLTASAGQGIKQFGDTIAHKAPHEGWAGSASQAVAEGIKGTGQYIEEHKLSGMAKDVEQVIRNHPIPALLVCFGIGYCIGRALKA